MVLRRASNNLRVRRHPHLHRPPEIRCQMAEAHDLGKSQSLELLGKLSFLNIFPVYNVFQ